MLFVWAVVGPAGAGLILAASVGLRNGALRKHYEKPANSNLRVSGDDVAYVVD